MVDQVARWRIAASGTVRLVEYRERVQRAAVAHHVVGAVENDRKDDERVLIDAQGAPADLLDFLEAIRGPEGRSDALEVLKIKELEPDPSRERFSIKRGRSREETLERVEFARHALTGLQSEIETLRGELDEKAKALGDSLADLGKEVGAAQASLEEQERSTRRSLASLSEELGKEIAALRKGLDSLATASARVERATQERFEALEGASSLIGKSLVRIEKALQAEVEEQEQQARSAEQQRTALLHLADQLARAGVPAPRRRRGLR